MALFSRHPLGLQTIYSDVKRRASEQPFVLVGTPGSVGEREVSGRRFFYRQFYDAAGKKRADYIGPVDEVEARERERAVRDVIGVTSGLLADARVLARAGYVRVDSRANAALAPFVNHGLFRAGAVLVGSHAFGASCNELGIRGAQYRTEDVDIARRSRLAVDGATFEEILAESKLELSPILGFDRKRSATSFKTPGRDALRVDLLAPARGAEPIVVPVPELRAHAMGLPHFDYLLADAVDAVVLGRDGVLPVRVPQPERLAWHKALVSELRSHTSERRTKDLHQSAVLVAALAESEPGALEDAFASLSRTQRAKIAPAAHALASTLAREGHAAGAEVVQSLTGAR